MTQKCWADYVFVANDERFHFEAGNDCDKVGFFDLHLQGPFFDDPLQAFLCPSHTAELITRCPEGIKRIVPANWPTT